MKKVTRGWPPSRRREQAEIIRRTRPWTRSTGPRTATGKATCARNGYRRSLRSPTYLQFRALLRWQYQFTRAVLKGHPLPPMPSPPPPPRRHPREGGDPSCRLREMPPTRLGKPWIPASAGMTRCTTVSFDSQGAFG